ncbi:hypothetical protein PNP59_09910 [Halobacterium salinarum]|uniref:hypothetical protein n=1 Tax=Halobacterium salinarum TaxID=2242 RepID=UPI00255690E2|nr:hypothetical protein [Halobacterium salinarum]MDL0131245.1 hypothetical protein [Halobacterium salinarum]
MVSRECPTNPREASGLDPEAVHQLTSYILTLDIPGVLIYPGNNGITATSTVGDTQLHSFELPIDAPATTYDEYVYKLQAAAKHLLKNNPPT